MVDVYELQEEVIQARRAAIAMEATHAEPVHAATAFA
jgi:hypothetical protein